MWRLIVVTFGFLGWAFYSLSGGADYAPAEGSRQHAAAVAADQPAAPAVRVSSKSAEPGSARVVLASAQLPPAESGTAKRVHLTLNSTASATAQTAGVTTVAADPDKIARLVAVATAGRNTPAPKPAATVASASADEGEDLRQVKPARVNLREGPGTDFDIAGKLTRGTRVAVLRDDGEGWVKLRVLDTGRVGWMADYLLIAAN